ncbi:MAG: ATP-binding protein [Candidatus Hodarchaeales archaeon]
MWIVSGSERGMIKLVSSNKVDGLLPVGSYLTLVDEHDVKHILQVVSSRQESLFEPSTLLVDADLPILKQDQICKNIILAREIRQYPRREDGMYSFIKPNETAQRITQEEIDNIFPTKEGYRLFLATSFLSQNSILQDDNGKLISVRVPFESLYLQTMISGQTGSGKTVAMKYLIEEFLKHEKGAVLAINVKGIDLLTMDQETEITNEKLRDKTRKEWESTGQELEEMGDFKIYVPYSNQQIKERVTKETIRKITLRTRDLEPNSLLGILTHVTDRAAETLPNIFRYWKERGELQEMTFGNFIDWFSMRANKEAGYLYPTLSLNGEESQVVLHSGTCRAVLRSLETVRPFFDNADYECIALNEDHILVPEKLSVIDLSNKNTVTFGAVLFRHLISKIYESKAVIGNHSDLPILIIIDEVHQFYRSGASEQALEELNAIARMGRSEKIGVIFASQNPGDLPKGLTAIVNTRIFFRSLGSIGRQYDVKNADVELHSLESGYAIISNVSLPEINFVKFPIPKRGVQS